MSSKKLNGSEILVECLLEQGVETVFGYPGGAVLNIYDALYKYSDKINHVLTAHEQGASHAADGFARATGTVGVCIATSGPGATNLVTGLATAYMDSIPVVAITGNVTVPLLGRDSFQEVDIVGITIPVTKHNFIVKNVDELASVVRLAFEIAMSGRPGPVLIDIPKDVSAALTQYEKAPAVVRRVPIPPKPERLEMAVEALRSSKKPLFYIGGGVISAGAEEEVAKLSKKLCVPVCASMMGLGGFPSNHPHWLGMVGMHGSLAANKAAKECDVLIVAGARFSDRVAGNPEKFSPFANVIHIDIDHAEFDKNVVANIRLAGDLKEVLSIIESRVDKADNSSWLNYIIAKKVEKIGYNDDENSTPDPLYILQKLRELTPENTLVATDVGQHQMWVAQHFNFALPRTLMTSGGLGTMGYGLGAAIGAQLAFPDRQTILISGDGSFHMNLNELATLASYHLPIVVLLFNNGVLGMVRQWQKVFYKHRFSATDPHRKTDFVKLAEAFGCVGMRITKTGEVEDVIKKALLLKKPVVIDCKISPNCNVLPMIPPGATVDEIIEVDTEFEQYGAL